MLDKKEVFKILRDQNPWYSSPPKTRYLDRDGYLDELEATMGSKAITVIKGPRRSGKSVLLWLLIERMKKGGIDKTQFLYVNLDDYRFMGNESVHLLELTIEAYRENINPDRKAFVLFDEIQNIPGFEKFLKTMQDSKLDVKFMISGSNSRLLSKELGSLLTGRISTVEVLPFSFKEYLSYRGTNPKDNGYLVLERDKSNYLKNFSDYVQRGGIPEFLEEPDPAPRLREYFENVIYRDIVERFGIRNPVLIKQTAVFLATNAAKKYSVNGMSAVFAVAINTLSDYLADLQMAYLFFYVPPFTYSLKKRARAQSKVYGLDTGLLNAVAFRLPEDSGRLLENLVCIELMRTGSEVYYHDDEEGECDFILKSGPRVISAIQVCEDMADPKVRTRELSGLESAMREYDLKEGLVLTREEYDDIQLNKHKVRVRPVWFWLLNKDE